jgi:hypothetical protein
MNALTLSLVLALVGAGLWTVARTQTGRSACAFITAGQATIAAAHATSLDARAVVLVLGPAVLAAAVVALALELRAAAP